MKEITEAMRTRRKDARAHAIQFNKDLNSTIVDCQRILSERCSKLFNIKFNEFGGNPVRCWQYLATHCGPASLGNSDVSSVFVRFIEMKMEPSQRLSEFLIEWDKLREYTKCNNDIARALLLSDAKIGKYGIQVLPDRLKDAVRRCKDDDKTYDECRQYLLTKDDQAHAAGDLPGNSKRANAVYCQEAGGGGSTSSSSAQDDFNYSIKCFNCNNRGHTVDQCQLDACGHCKNLMLDTKAS
jgi:hypothetical protein